MNRICFMFALILLLAGCQQKELLTGAPLTSQPRDIQFITSDIDLFWQMIDAEKPLFTAEEVTNQYINAGTPALAYFYRRKVKKPDALADLMNSWIDRNYYEGIRENSLQIADQQENTVHALKAFKKLYPAAAFTDIIFIMGTLNSGGVVLPNGQIVIAAEMFSKGPDTDTSHLNDWLQSVLKRPDDLPVIIIHELVHLQQQQYAKQSGRSVGGESLLDRALLEGSADFITHLVLDNFLNRELLAYGDPKEEQLWNQFRKKMHRQDLSDWLYNGNTATDKPADLGYYMGYKIVEHFYENSPDKQQAIREIIQMKNGKTFLQKSGYKRKFE